MPPARPVEHAEEIAKLRREFEAKIQEQRDLQAQQYQVMHNEMNQLRMRNGQLQAELQQHGGAQVGVGLPMTRVLKGSDAKLSIALFDGTEVYRVLGAGFVQWERQFLVKISLAEEASGHRWPGMYKTSRLGEFLRGKALSFFSDRLDGWWDVQLTLIYVLSRMENAYKITFSKQQIVKLFTARKEPSMSWNDHLLYLVALMEATQSGPEMVLENIVKHASVEMKTVLMSRVNMQRTDHLAHTEELVAFVQQLEDESLRKRRRERRSSEL